MLSLTLSLLYVTRYPRVWVPNPSPIPITNPNPNPNSNPNPNPNPNQVASAIAYIHSLNIQHRDLKPDNVMLDASGRAKIIDFGLACISDASRSRSRTKVGTDAYSSPEKAKSERYGPADDVWAIGCMLAELLLGRPIGTVSSSTDKLKRAITGSKAASQQLGSWVEGCLQMEPRRRPTAQDIETSINDTS